MWSSSLTDSATKGKPDNSSVDFSSRLTNLNEMISLSLDKFVKNLNETDIDTDQSEYLQFCDANRKLDQFIGYSLVLTECEKRNIVADKIHPTISHLLDILKNTKDFFLTDQQK